MITLVQIELSLADPSEVSILLAAAEWAEGLLLGTLATVIAVIAIAAVGYLESDDIRLMHIRSF